jgi:hypothetical protein
MVSYDVTGSEISSMFQCYRHPDREGSFYCQKDGNYMCRECACCHTPSVYCQYRTACVIHLLTREGELKNCEEQGEIFADS